MAETPNHAAGKGIGCGFMGAIFGIRPRKTPPPQLQAPKHHRRTGFSAPRTTTTEFVYAGFSKPKPPAARRLKPPTVAKNPPAVAKNPKPVAKNQQSVAKKLPPKPSAVAKKPPIKPVYDSLSKSASHNVSQVTNVTYTKRLREEASFTSSELVSAAPNRLMFRASGNVMVPGHLGNLMKKPDSSKTATNVAKRSDPDALKAKGNEMYKQGKYDEAVALYTEAIGIDSTTASYYSNRAAALIGLGNLVDAILDCKIAIRIDPSYHRAHYRLAGLYLRFGDVEKASCHYKCAGSKAERKDVAKCQAVKAQLETCHEARRDKNWKRLSEESRFAASLGADYAIQVYAMQAEALLNLRRHQEAYSGFLNAPSVDVNVSAQLFGPTVTANFLMIQSQVYLASGRFEEAVSAALRASELDLSEEVLNVGRKTRAVAKARANGNRAYKASQFAEACNVYTEGLELEPHNSVLLCNRAACRQKLGQFEKAVEDCTAALILRPSYAKARLRRAECNAKLERWETVVRDYELLSQETRADDAARNALSEARIQLERRRVEDVKLVKLINDSGKENLKGF